MWCGEIHPTSQDVQRYADFHHAKSERIVDELGDDRHMEESEKGSKKLDDQRHGSRILVRKYEAAARDPPFLKLCE